MTTTKLLSAALVAAAMFTTPALAAREHRASGRHPVDRIDDSASLGSAYAYEPYAYGSYGYQPYCVPAPRVGAFATAPWDRAAPCEPYYYMGY